jgi:ABC-type dipeptide/oligopeptide/nickel transport system permease component
MKGIREKSLIFKYSLRESMIPVITMFGMSLGNLLAGAIVVEILFSWPGLGKMVVEAIMNRDYPLIQAYILLSGIFVMSINLIVDLSYYLLDPKLRRKEQRA